MNGREQLTEWLMDDDPTQVLRKSLSELFSLLPELAPCYGFDHKHPHHHLDVWEHTLLALSRTPARLAVRLAALLHDCGKPVCFTEGEVRHFYGHPEMSAKLCRSALDRLGFSDRITEYVTRLVRMHDTPVRKAEADQLNFYLDLFDLQYADTMAHAPDKLSSRHEYLEGFKALLQKCKPDPVSE